MFTELEMALMHRAINTERNFLARLYGKNPEGGTVFGFTPDTMFSAGWQEQIDALNSAEKKLNGMEVSNGLEV